MYNELKNIQEPIKLTVDKDIQFLIREELIKFNEIFKTKGSATIVMNIKNAGLNSAFIVRKISSGIGVERTFQLHSPMIDSIAVKRKGDVRQAKLYYLRERSGRSARIKERLD